MKKVELDDLNLRWAPKLPSKKRLVMGVAVFMFTAIVGMVANIATVASRLGYGTLGVSISRCVGAEVWSAILFVVGCVVMAIATASYLWKVGEVWRMPKLYYLIIVIMAAGLIWLSVFPIGMFDIAGQPSVVSLMHELGTRVTFLMMLMIAATMVGNPWASSVTHVVGYVYVIFGIFSVVSFLMRAPWFMNNLLIFELIFILGFIGLLVSVANRKKN